MMMGNSKGNFKQNNMKARAPDNHKPQANNFLAFILTRPLEVRIMERFLRLIQGILLINKPNLVTLELTLVQIWLINNQLLII